MSFPWASKINTRTIRTRDKTRLALWRPCWRQSLRWSVSQALSGAALLALGLPAAAEPLEGLVPGGGPWIGAKTITPEMRNLTTRTLTVEQTQQRAILNWTKLNIEAGERLRFDQQAASWVALNRIHNQDPTRINGAISARGQVYLLSQNGIIFGKDAVIDTHTLIASTLNIRDNDFINGLTNPINRGEAAFDATVEGWNMNLNASIQVESGAVLKSAEGGRIMVFAPLIENRGEISTPGGQAVLAASRDKVFLATSEDENLRGLLVEVDTGGSIENLGQIIAERGNASLIGYAINQNGLVRATTAVDVNGSVRLLARDRAAAQVVTGRTNGPEPRANRTGDLVLGANSVTEVQPAQLDELAVDGQTQQRSRIEAMGNTIRLDRGAKVLAPSGEVTLTATTRPQSQSAGPVSDSRIFLATDSVIDVSGVDTTVLPMERNLVKTKLFGLELADSPVQRDGPLRRQEVTIDVRKGTPLADVRGAIESLRRPLGERLAGGGTVALRSEGDVILQSGAVVDVSGGKVEYQAGFLNTTQLISEGRLYDISTADPKRRYDGIYGTYERVHRKWGVSQVFNTLGATYGRNFEPGYIEGKDAGSLSIDANRSLALDGTLRGGATRGRWQRDPSSELKDGELRPYTEVPLGGKLAITVANQRLVNFVPLVAPQNLAFESPIPNGLPLELASDTLLGGGFNRVSVAASLTDSTISLPDTVRLALQPGGELALTANYIAMNGAIEAPGGTVRLTTKARNTASTELSGVQLGDKARIDVRGRWVNDNPLLTDAAQSEPLFIDGGTAAITAEGDVRLARGSVIDVGGGAQREVDGDLVAGKGGEISITSDSPNSAVPTRLVMDGELRGYGIEQGGNLKLQGSGFRVRSDTPPGAAIPGQITLRPEFFQQGGFQSYELIATRTGFAVEDGVQVNLRPHNLELAPGYALQPVSANLDRFSRAVLLPDFARAPTSLSVDTRRRGTTKIADQDAILRIGTGARVETQVGGTIALSADTDIVIDGSLVTPAGTISLALDRPSDTNELGYRPNQAIRLGPESQLNAFGASRVRPLPTQPGPPLRQGEVLSGGRVDLRAQRGYIVTAPGSLIDVSGTTQVLDLPIGAQGQPVPVTVAGAAGEINLTAAEGMVLGGELRGRPGGVDGRGGSLALTIDPSQRIPSGQQVTGRPFPEGQRAIVLGRSADTYFGPGESIPDVLNGLALLDPQSVRTGGFDALSLRVLPVTQNSQAAIRFEGDVTLEAGRRIRLDAPIIAVSDGGTAQVRAPYVGIGPSDTTLPRVTLADATPGTGRFTVQAQHIDLIGTTALQGVGATLGATESPVNLISSGDIRAIGTRLASNEPSRALPGKFISPASIALQAAQIYPATLTDFELVVGGPEGRIAVTPSGNPAETITPLSVGGSLKLTASHIEQAGVLRAPFGELRLAAEKSLTLTQGSVTSTSSAGLTLPFGRTEFGTDWLYKLDNNLTRVVDSTPRKRVDLQAAAVRLEPGAVIDLAGGGDLLAYEFIPGAGGSTDILQANNPQGAFAILSGYNPGFGVYDPSESPAPGIAAGATITLAAGGGVAAGEYAVLPARYALLPGAFLVTPVAGARDILPNVPRTGLDGVTTVAGRRGTAGGAPYESRWNGYTVENGAQTRARAEYAETLASAFFARPNAATATPERPADAGSLRIDAGQSLLLQGSILAGNAGGRGAQADIVADQLAVVTTYTSAPNRVEISAQDLNNLGAESLLLGGTRTRSSLGTTLDVAASAVTVESGAELTAPEILLAASNTVTVQAGASLRGSGSAATTDETLFVSGDGALARVSSGDQVRVERANSDGREGVLTIASGATLYGERSITLDASLDTNSRGSLETNEGSISLGASRISLGSVDPARGDGLVLSNADLAALKARELILNSRGSLNLFGDINLQVNRLIVDTAGLAGYGNAATTLVTATDAIELRNTRAASFTGSGNPTDSLSNSNRLQLSAREVVLGDGTFAIRGFNGVDIAATEGIVGKGAATLNVASDLSLRTPRLSGSSGADIKITTEDASNTVVGAITLVNATTPGAGAPLPALDSLGTSLDVVGSAITLDTRIDMASGLVKLRATGDSGAVTLGSNAVIDLAGKDKRFDDLIVGSPGGSAKLIAERGDVRLADGATISVAAAAGGHGGKLELQAAQGTVDIAAGARLTGGASAGNEQGRLAVDANRLGPQGFSGLTAQAQAGGFTESLGLRLRSGNLTIAAGDVVRAHRVQLSADAGTLDLLGTIDASGVQGGKVALNARDDLTVRGSARIDAHATGLGEKGGKVELGTVAGRIDIQPTDTPDAATIDVSGTADTTGPGGARIAQDTGRVRLRAPRTGPDTAAFTAVAGTIRGAERIDAEAYRVYTASTINNELVARIQNETAAFMANAGTIERALGKANDAAFHLIPGVEIQSDGDLRLNTDTAWNLFTWRDGGEPGILTLRAAGNLRLDQSLSDGFARQSVALSQFGGPLPERDVVQQGPAWSYRLVAGASLAGADPLAVVPAATGDTGNLALASGVHVRTGTGDIQVAAGGDVVLSDPASVLYTAGENRGTGTLAPYDVETTLRGDFVHRGGDIDVFASGDIRGVTNQVLPDWLPRFGGTLVLAERDLPAAWAVDFSKFQQGIGALGGGNVRVIAGGDVQGLSIALPTTGQPTGDASRPVAVAGGGNLKLEAEGDIRGGVYLLGRGQADIRSGGAITGVADNTGATLYPILLAADAQYVLQARKGVTLETAFNPTVATPDPNQGLPDEIFQFPGSTYFFTYSERSTIDLTALSGDIEVRADFSSINRLHNRASTGGDTPAYTLFPGSFTAQSLQGDIRSNGSFNLYPTPQGTLRLLAEKDITGNGGINLSDADVGLLPTVEHLQDGTLGALNQILGGHAPRPVHEGDTDPVRIVARTGSISTRGLISISKPARLYAGLDISNPFLFVQHADANSVTRLEAARDIVYSGTRLTSGALENNGIGISIAGPGRLDLLVGRDVDLGTSAGILSLGNLQNPSLPDGGAEITILAGLSRQPDYAAFTQRYLADTSAYAQRLETFVARFPGDAALSDIENFRNLPEDRRREFLLAVFFDELRAAGVAATTEAAQDYSPGYEAIATLFPGEGYEGSIKSFLSQITTLNGGGINLLVPGGLVNAGVTATSSLTKEADQLGIVVQRTGDLNAFLRQDFLVNQSRVFALDGGDILVWSSEGNIDAGRGARSALSIPPATTTFDTQGNAMVMFPPIISGSGIRAAVSTPGNSPGNVYLFAPTGVVNAGEAGIETAGNLTIGATAVLGADVIQVGGIATGVPTDSGGLSAGLAGVGDIAATANKVAEDAVKNLANNDNGLSSLDVQVTGYGEDQGDNSVEIRKRKPKCDPGKEQCQK